MSTAENSQNNPKAEQASSEIAADSPDFSPYESQDGDSTDDSTNDRNCVIQRPSIRMMLEAAQTAKMETETSAMSFGLPTAPPPRKSAIFVAHGMGQQLKYETLDQIAQGLLELDARARGGKRKQPDTEIISVPCDGGVIRGIKLLLLDKGGDKKSKADDATREVHIFEGYWAPLTEGQISLRDVIGFLFTAGLNGLKNRGADFKRWLFGKNRSFSASLTVTLYLITTVAVIASLVVMNTAIVTVAAVSSPLTNTPKWLPALKPDLTTTFNIFVFFAVLLGLAVGLAAKAREKRWSASSLERMALVCWILFALTIGATILCGLAILLLFYGHVYRPMTETAGFWKISFGAETIDGLNCGISLFILAIILLAALAKVLGRKKKRSRYGFWKRLSRVSGWVWLAVIGVLGLVITVIGNLAFAVFSSSPIMHQWSWQSFCDLLSGISWPLLMLVSWQVRKLLVQYVGDVAVYITPHTLDRFNSLREKIRETVVGAAKAVYAARKPGSQEFEYDDVFIVGHSLGSVIVYDTLNRLINDDEFLENEKKLRVSKRTRLLLTFGSPLDKISFLFAMQKERTSEEREALAGAAQPLIQQAVFRQFDWINLYSPHDIISGDLNFYDLPRQSGGTISVKRVKNEIDRRATTLLAAHVEYWENPLLFKRLHEKLLGIEDEETED